MGFTAGAGAFGASGDKGKGRDFDMGSSETGGNVGSEVVPGTGDGEEEDAAGVKGEKKMKNNYKHLIKGLPGAFLFSILLWIHDSVRLWGSDGRRAVDFSSHPGLPSHPFGSLLPSSTWTRY